ncbi:MAG: HAD family hydrolase [Deltaproteobacteria bacterium]|nr:HAD family hydrolase [Deltaproteobacteria bacterium]
MGVLNDDLLERHHWIFDLDGTLTVPAHDFDAMRRELGIPAGVGILEALDALDEAAAAPKRAQLFAWEREIAAAARLQPDARALLDALVIRAARLGVLTRNSAPNALETLRVVGLDGYFDPAFVLGRDDAAHKPSSEGVLRLLDLWGADPGDAVMVGDYVHDLRAGRAAGVATVLVDRRERGADWVAFADRVVDRLDALLDHGE